MMTNESAAVENLRLTNGFEAARIQNNYQVQ